MRTAAGETDLRRRAEMLAEVERLLLEEEPVVPLLFYESKNLVSKRVQGWRDNLLDRHLARYLSVERGSEASQGKRTFRNLATAAKQRVRCRNSA
jgi:oligopeptide transport system substrate-binding protein